MIGGSSNCDCGFSKGTLYYMKKNAEGDQPFTMNKHVRERLDRWDKEVKTKT